MFPEYPITFEKVPGAFFDRGDTKLLHRARAFPLIECSEGSAAVERIAAAFEKWDCIARGLASEREQFLAVKRGNHRHETTYISARQLGEKREGVGVVIVTRQARKCLGAVESVLSSECRLPLFRNLMDQRLLNVEYIYAIPPRADAEPVGIVFFPQAIVRFSQNKVRHPEWPQPYNSVYDYQTELVPVTEPITDPRRIKLLDGLADFLLK